MDTQQAKDILAGMMTSRAKEIDALKMATDILDAKLSTELFELNAVRAELEQVTAERDQVVAERDTLQVELSEANIERI